MAKTWKKTRLRPLRKPAHRAFEFLLLESGLKKAPKFRWTQVKAVSFVTEMETLCDPAWTKTAFGRSPTRLAVFMCISTTNRYRGLSTTACVTFLKGASTNVRRVSRSKDTVGL